MRYLSLVAGLLAFLAQPAGAASSPRLQALERQLQWMMASRPGDNGLAALDLRTGELIGVRADEPFPMASTVKVAIAANYLAQVDNGRRSLDRKIGGRSAATLLEAMIVHSDNHATDLLLRDLGGPGTVEAWLEQHGLQGMRIDRTIAQLLRDRRDLYDTRDSSTPRAMVKLLQRLDSGKLLKPTGQTYLLSLMRRCVTGRNRIRGFLPEGTPVENKTGTLSGLTSDVGFITLQDGRRLAVAFFARNGGDRPNTIAWAARTIYDGFTAWLREPFARVPLGTR
jgi:beta-lactamase class A